MFHEEDLISAALDGNAGVVIDLLHNKKVPPNVHRADGITPLYGAAQNGYTRVVEILLKAGAIVDPPHTQGATPLFIASPDFLQVTAINDSNVLATRN